MNWVAVVVWAGLLGLFYFVATFLEEKAAMRGSNRQPLPGWMDKSIRVFFLATFVAPLGFVLNPWVFGIALALYLPTYLDGGERTGNRLNERFLHAPIFKLVHWYFKMDVVAAGGKLDPKRQYVIGLHPHGFLPFGTMVAVMSAVCDCQGKVLNGVRLRTLAASFCFFIPGYRDFILAGGIIDAARYNARRALDNGVSIALVPGGATEGLYASPGKHILVLKKRKGFVKLALETGCDLVPVYSFGETDCYHQLSDVWPWVRKVQSKFQRVMGLSLPLVTNIIPMRAKITVVFGKPIPVTKIAKPTPEQVDAMLELYMTRLKELFDAEAPKYIAKEEERKLVIL